MEVFTKLNAVEDEIFVEMDRISKEMVALKGKLTKLRELAKVMNSDRLKKPKSNDLKK
jgi:hypothetical protein